MQRWVLDTNVVASALLWGGSPALLLEAARKNEIALFSSVPLLRELGRILTRPKFASRLAMAAATPEVLVEGYAALVEALVHPHSTEQIAPDSDDDVVIGTALAADANVIVTGDKAFLGVGTYQTIRIVTVTEAVEELRVDDARE